MKINDYLEEAERYLRSLGYDVAYIGLYGSQNYNLEDEDSDIDLRALVYPSLEFALEKRKLSLKLTTGHGDIDVKDVLTYTDVIRKGNFSFIEPFQSPWYIGDERLRALFKDVPVNLMAMKGAIFQKLKTFYKHGDPKNISHALRLEQMIFHYHRGSLPHTASFQRYTNESIYRCLHIDLKRGKPLIYNLYKESDPDTVTKGFEEKLDRWIPNGYEYKPKEGMRKKVIEILKERILEHECMGLR